MFPKIILKLRFNMHIFLYQFYIDIIYRSTPIQ